MKLHDLTEKQVDKICDYILGRDALRDEQGFMTNFSSCCRNCPFSFYIGELNYYDCAKPEFERDLPEEFYEVIK